MKTKNPKPFRLTTFRGVLTGRMWWKCQPQLVFGYVGMGLTPAEAYYDCLYRNGWGDHDR